MNVAIVDPLALSEEQFDQEYFEEATWTATRSLAEEFDIEQTSDEFVTLYAEMKDAVEWASKFTAQICHTSLQAIKVLLLNGDLVLGVDEDEEPVSAISRVATTIATAAMVSVAAIKAGPDRGMLTNDQVKQLSTAERGVTFVFNHNEEGDNQ